MTSLHLPDCIVNICKDTSKTLKTHKRGTLTNAQLAAEWFDKHFEEHKLEKAIDEKERQEFISQIETRICNIYREKIRKNRSARVFQLPRDSITATNCGKLLLQSKACEGCIPSGKYEELYHEIALSDPIHFLRRDDVVVSNECEGIVDSSGSCAACRQAKIHLTNIRTEVEKVEGASLQKLAHMRLHRKHPFAKHKMLVEMQNAIKKSQHGMDMAPFLLPDTPSSFSNQFLNEMNRNINVPANAHRFSKEMMRFWICMRYFGGSRTLKLMRGPALTGKGRSSGGLGDYNLVVPSDKTIARWSPQARYGIDTERIKFAASQIRGSFVGIVYDGVEVNRSLVVRGSHAYGFPGMHLIHERDLKEQGDAMRDLSEDGKLWRPQLEVEALSKDMLQFFIVGVDGTTIPICHVLSPQKQKPEFLVEVLKSLTEELWTNAQKSAIFTASDGDVSNVLALREFRTWMHQRTEDVIRGRKFFHLYDFTHLVKNSRNRLIEGRSLRNNGFCFSMSTLDECMWHSDFLRNTITDDMICPSDKMSWLNVKALLHSAVIAELQSIYEKSSAEDPCERIWMPDAERARELALYLQKLKELYDTFNSSQYNLKQRMDTMKQVREYFQQLESFTEELRIQVISTLQEAQDLLQFLLDHGIQERDIQISAFGTNIVEKHFSVVRQKVKRPSAEEYCRTTALAFFVTSLQYCDPTVLGFHPYRPNQNDNKERRYGFCNIKLPLPEIKKRKKEKRVRDAPCLKHLRAKILGQLGRITEQPVRERVENSEYIRRRLLLFCPFHAHDSACPRSTYKKKHAMLNHLKEKHQMCAASAAKTMVVLRKLAELRVMLLEQHKGISVEVVRKEENLSTIPVLNDCHNARKLSTYNQAFRELLQKAHHPTMSSLATKKLLLSLDMLINEKVLQKKYAFNSKMSYPRNKDQSASSNSQLKNDATNWVSLSPIDPPSQMKYDQPGNQIMPMQVDEETGISSVQQGDDASQQSPPPQQTIQQSSVRNPFNVHQQLNEDSPESSAFMNKIWAIQNADEATINSLQANNLSTDSCTADQCNSQRKSKACTHRVCKKCCRFLQFTGKKPACSLHKLYTKLPESNYLSPKTRVFVLDTETTSRTVNVADLVEIYVKQIHPEKEEDNFQWLYCNTDHVSDVVYAEAEKIHRIPRCKTLQQPLAEEQVRSMWRWILGEETPSMDETIIIAAHNGQRFDIPMLQKYVSADSIPIHERQTVVFLDTLRFLPDRRPFLKQNLGSIYDCIIGGSIPEQHSAKGDVEALERVLKKSSLYENHPSSESMLGPLWLGHIHAEANLIIKREMSATKGKSMVVLSTSKLRLLSKIASSSMKAERLKRRESLNGDDYSSIDSHLSATIIDYIFQEMHDLLSEEGTESSVSILNSTVLLKLLRDKDEPVETWTTSPFHTDSIKYCLIPMCLGGHGYGSSDGHWVLLHIDKERRELCVLNSMDAVLLPPVVTETLIRWMNCEEAGSIWRISNISLPQQTNGRDCGLYILMAAASILKNDGDVQSALNFGLNPEVYSSILRRMFKQKFQDYATKKRKRPIDKAVTLSSIQSISQIRNLRKEEAIIIWKEINGHEKEIPQTLKIIRADIRESWNAAQEKPKTSSKGKKRSGVRKKKGGKKPPPVLYALGKGQVVRSFSSQLFHHNSKVDMKQ